jgi:hypothetical protein
VQARSRRLPSERGLLLQLHEFHVSLRSLIEGLSLRWPRFGHARSSGLGSLRPVAVAFSHPTQAKGRQRNDLLTGGAPHAMISSAQS